MAKIGRPKKEPVLCSVPNCKKYASGLGFCDTHYKRFKKGQDLTKPIRVWGSVAT